MLHNIKTEKRGVKIFLFPHFIYIFALGFERRRKGKELYRPFYSFFTPLNYPYIPYYNIYTLK